MFKVFSIKGNMAMNKVNLSQKFRLFKEYWTPKIVGELNGQYVKLVKIKGDFVWHKHDVEDELFMVIKGSMTIKLREKNIQLDEGELCIVPRGIEHKPAATEETYVLVFEPKSTLNTGDAESELTVKNLDWI